MEQIIIEALGGNLDGATLLMLFIIGILTKRFVPWWVHEEALKKLKEYEDAAPVLLDEVSTLIDLLHEEDYDERRNGRERFRERQDNLHHVVRDSPRVRPRRKRTQ